MTELYNTLMSIPSGKRPGPNGFNVEFYKFFWFEIHEKLFVDVNYFFKTTYLPNSWGLTYIVLIPKKNKPISITDYRPILFAMFATSLLLRFLPID